jgi:uncharacterized protein YecT (DUF1311 family)
MRQGRFMLCATVIVLLAVNPVFAEPDEVDKIIAEKRVALLMAHPACTEMFKQEEMNPGDNDLHCANFEFEVADKELNAIYKSARASLSDERKTFLKKEQIVWIKEKEQFCEGAADRSLSMSPRFREAATNFCLAASTRKRTEYLKSF